VALLRASAQQALLNIKNTSAFWQNLFRKDITELEIIFFKQPIHDIIQWIESVNHGFFHSRVGNMLITVLLRYRLFS